MTSYRSSLAIGPTYRPRAAAANSSASARKQSRPHRGGKPLLRAIGIALAVLGLVSLIGVATTATGDYMNPPHVTIAWAFVAGLDAVAFIAYGTAAGYLLDQWRQDNPVAGGRQSGQPDPPVRHTAAEAAPHGQP